MLYQQDSEPTVAVELFQSFDQSIGLGWPQSCHDLVEQKQFRIGGKRTGKFQTLSIGKCEREGALRAWRKIEPPQNFM